MDYAPCNDNCKLNYHFRMQRRRELVQRLRDHFKAGRATDKVPVTTTRTFLNGFCNKLSEVECGLIVKRAFPSAQRKRSNNTWYYYGLQCKDQKAANTTLPDYTGNMYCKPSSSKKETPEEESQNASEAACSDDGILKEQAVSRSSDFHEDTNATKGVKMFVDIINQQVDLIRAPEIMQSSKQAEQQAYCKPFCIPSLNLCKEDMSDLEAGQLIGAGTFGYCIAGSYKGIPTAFKIFKDLSDYKEVHTEANFLLKIPSHPGIPLLIGVCTSSTPFVLATKLCETVGKPETFSSFLRGQQKFRKPNLPLALKLLLSIGEVLNHLFSVGILHNDIKGNNVVLEDANDLKRGVLIDFGKACYAAEAKESVHHRLMNFNERRLYRERFPHVAPEVSDGKKPSQSSDIYSFGHMYCLTMKAMKDVLGTQEKQLLELGKQISHFRPHKRPNIAMVLEKLANFSSSYPE